jgi:hypothetical protein
MASYNWSVELPKLIDNEYLNDSNVTASKSSDGYQLISIPPMMGCFIYTLNLCRIKEDILSIFYGIPNTSVDYSAMVELDQRLNEFEATLPSWLMTFAQQELSGTSKMEFCALQVNVLRAR